MNRIVVAIAALGLLASSADAQQIICARKAGQLLLRLGTCRKHETQVNVADLEGNDPGDKGPKGDKGDKGDPGPFVQTLPSGQMLRGVYEGSGDAQGSPTTAADSSLDIQALFAFPLAAAPTGVHFIPSGGTPPADCPGTVSDPKAAPGHLCVYEKVASNRASVCVLDPLDYATCGTANRFGFGIYFTAVGTGFIADTGTWAVTAP